MNKNQLKGKIFEEILKYYLKNHGYVSVPKELEDYYGISKKHNGTNVRGRGGDHQIDALGQFEFQIPFVYPIRLISEAKCQRKKIGIEVVRNFVGVLKDISENYFSDKKEEKFRFSDCGAIFSTSNFTKGAQMYAYAQGVYLITIKEVLPLIDKIVKNKGYFNRNDGDFLRRLKISEVAGKDEFYYFGVASGLYPLVIRSEKKIPFHLFKEKDKISVRIYYEKEGEEIEYFMVSFGGWEGKFQLPKYLWKKYLKTKSFRREMIGMKRRVLDHIDIPLNIGGIRRIIRLNLDKPWLELLERNL